MSLNKLFFNSIDITIEGNVVTINPNFHCPTCGQDTWFKVPTTFTIPSNRDLDINRSFTFKFSCEHSPTLYMAVHKTRNVDDLSLNVSVEPILANWWVKP